MFRLNICALALACFVASALASSYPAPSSYAAPSAYVAPSSYAADVIRRAEEAEAKAAAQTSGAGAQASAAKINAVNWDALNRYGHEIGVPLLVRNYGPLTNLYAAGLPPRSFVGRIDPVFVRGPYGNIQHISETSIGVAAI